MKMDSSRVYFLEFPSLVILVLAFATAIEGISKVQADDPAVRAATQRALELNHAVNGEKAASCEPSSGAGAGLRYQTSIYQKDGVISGTWCHPVPERCTTLRIFFPGQAQELGIYKASVPVDKRSKWGAELLEGKGYHLAPTLVEAGCPVLLLGESQLTLNAEDLRAIVEESGANQVELLAHSAGYTGLTTLVAALKGSSLISKVSAVKLLDNFYTPGVLPEVLKTTFGSERLREICSGFYTEHNALRYQSGFKSLCPKVERKGDHKSPVKDHFR